MRSILLATSNRGKVREIRELLEGLEFSVLTLDDFPDLNMPPEDGQSFRENALIKARYAARLSGHMALADDSGLEVKGLGGAPGIRSARYACEGATDDENIDKLIKETARLGEVDRRARFVCALALCFPPAGEGEQRATEAIFEGTLDGLIISERRGSGGFGYDPVFYITELERSAAELTRAEKSGISHRGKALRKLKAYLLADFRGSTHKTGLS
jgi:XTP/dITP diphosphohydrolase